MAKTFSFEDNLPNLPVPSLATTIEKYLYSVRAVATDGEYQNTKRNCEEFLQSHGPFLQSKLKEREKVHRNWIEEIWLNNGYLELRMPLHFINFAGTASFHEQCWPFKDGTQITRAAFTLHALAKFWKKLVNEEVEPHKNSKGKPFSMHQFRTSFNTCQVPHRDKDELVSYFKTSTEGTAPSHSIIIYKGHLFKIMLISPQTGNPYTPPQFTNVLCSIVAKCEASQRVAEGVAALTALDRNTWADIRDHMIEISDRNHKNLLDIQSAVHVASLDEDFPKDFTDLLFNSLTGDPTQRWRDKSYNSVWSKNGGYGASSCHAAVDGMVMVMYNEFVTMFINQSNGVWTGSNSLDDLSPFEELVFDLDEKVKSGIIKGKQSGKELRDAVSLLCPVFDGVGKVDLQKSQVYPDAFVQICLHLTYMKLFGKPAPAYETATTRQFFHGRTETCRTCTPEIVAFCEAFIAGRSSQNLQRLLKTAYEKLIWLMRECQDNRGCDRHLYGLLLEAAKHGISPKIFSDPMYSKSGGNGNFVLSTSFVGFFNSSGVVTPMVEDGFGIFYRINEHRIVVTLTSLKSSEVTDINKFCSTLGNIIPEVYSLFCSMNESKL